MAYLEQRSSQHRTAIVGAVALLHGAAFYALVSGLAVHAVAEIETILEARNIPVDIPEPKPLPSPPPTGERHVQQKTETVTTFTLPPIGRTLPPFEEILPPLHPQDPDPFPRPTPSVLPKGATPLGNPGTWVTTNDYPARDLREGNQGVTGFSVSIGADGRVQDCTVTSSSGFPGLDEATCRLIERRARFRAATDGDGHAAAGTWSSRVRWSIPAD